MTHKVCIAPMLNHTDRHFRFLMRLLSKNTVLYTEMITTGALLHADASRLLKFNEVEHPLAIQLGGNNPAELAACATMAEQAGYDEINLNIGCPSSRVQNGKFGACLMSDAKLVADCVNAMQANVNIPVTIKTRTGIDHHDGYAFLKNFIETVQSAGCNTFIIHARKAFLSGLSPRENRDIPPLMYNRVYQIKADFPKLNIIINGGITGLDRAAQHLNKVDGVMLGRVAYQNPYMLADIDRLFFNGPGIKISRAEIVNRYREYARQQLTPALRPGNLTRHLIGLYRGQPGTKQYRRILSESADNEDSKISYVNDALRAVSSVQVG